MNLTLFYVWEDVESGLTEIIPLVYMPTVRGQYPIFSQSSSGLTHGSGYSLMAARWQIFFVSFPSFLRVHQLTISGICNHQWRWLPLFTDMAGNILFFNLKSPHLTCTESVPLLWWNGYRAYTSSLNSVHRYHQWSLWQTCASRTGHFREN